MFTELYKSSVLNRNEIRAEIDFLIEIVSGLKYKDFLLGKCLSEDQVVFIKKCITERIETGKPLQQILGEAFFFGEKFYVDENTLIPRPETELIVQKCLELFDRQAEFSCLDIGTGSGCIAVMIAKLRKKSFVTAIDIKPKALQTAIKNAQRHGVADRIDFKVSDLLDNVQGMFDVIVSNPPYISHSEISEVDKNVLKFEPHSALFAEENGLEFYQKIICSIRKSIKPKGVVIFEIGRYQAKTVKKLLTDSHFLNIEIIKDLNDYDRVICAETPE